MTIDSGEPDINPTSKRLTMGSIGSFHFEVGGSATAHLSRINPA